MILGQHSRFGFLAWIEFGLPMLASEHCTEFRRATLLESWELALTLAEQPRYGVGMVEDEFGRDAALRLAGQSHDEAKLGWMFC